MNMEFSRRAHRISNYLLVLCALALIGCGRGGPGDTGRGRKMIILGFDGVDPTWMNKWIAEGKLPNLAKLKAQGDFRELGSTIPPQSPVAWSSFATGTNPGGHGIYDFVSRSPENYTPGVATMDLRPPRLLLGLLPTEKAHGEMTRGGTSFWKVAADSGVRASLLTIPYSFPPENVGSGRMLSGLGVPDLRETNSSFTYMATDLTPEEMAQPVGGGRLVKVNQMQGEIGAFLEATINPKTGQREKIPINFSIQPDGLVEIRLDGNTVQIQPGQWSRWLPFHYNVTPLLKVSGICRVHLFTSQPEFRIYITPLCMDPSDPYMPISYPESFSRELFERVGYFKTVGWAYDTSALNEERLTDDAFLEDMKSITADREKIFLSELERRDWDLFVGVFTATDRVFHMFYRYLDPQHPLYDPVEAAKYEEGILWPYQHMDRFVGMVMDQFVDAQTTLLVLSDHGFHSFRRGFHTNTWLAQHGYLFFKGMEKLARGQQIPADLYPKGELFPKVVWSKTRAYALGTGQIYINLMGREGQGVVRPGEEYNRLTAEISAGLLEVRDPLNGLPVIKAVYKGKDVFKGSYKEKAPDLQLGFHEGYRTSKETMLGGIPSELLSNNLNKWSGDHASSAVDETSGILLSNRKLLKEDPQIIDIAATVLEYFNVPKLPEMEGSSVFQVSGGIAGQNRP